MDMQIKPYESPDHKARRYLYIGVAKAFKSNPIRAREIGLEKIKFIGQNMSDDFISKWVCILSDASNREVLNILVKKHEPYESLRQTCPMIFVLTKKEILERKKAWKRIKSKK
ncbi:MAG: hypothetical protein IBX55_00975 [Methyloprofundus sp.]|nr:hypothetical protein [Methyloprofundus sp.]